MINPPPILQPLPKPRQYWMTWLVGLVISIPLAIYPPDWVFWTYTVVYWGVMTFLLVRYVRNSRRVLKANAKARQEWRVRLTVNELKD